LWVQDSLGPWLHQVAIRHARRMRARSARRSSFVAGIEVRDSTREHADMSELVRLVHEEIGALPDKYRVPVVLFYLEHHTCEQVAAHVRCPVGTVKIRLMRARERLHRALERRGLCPAIVAPFSAGHAGMRAALEVAEAGGAALEPLAFHAFTTPNAPIAVSGSFAIPPSALGALASTLLLVAAIVVAYRGLDTRLDMTVESGKRGTESGPWDAHTDTAFIPIDLSRWCNRQLEVGLEGLEGNSLSNVPRGRRVLAGIPFRIGDRLVHLNGSEDASETGLPQRIGGLPIAASVRRVHVLHATQFGGVTDEVADGVEVATLVVRYSDGTSVRARIAYGRDVRDWWYAEGDPAPTNAAVAWVGTNPAANAENKKIRLYAKSWTNPNPGKRVETIDVESKGTRCEPLLIALTCET
jgi:hypothetical protein